MGFIAFIDINTSGSNIVRIKSESLVTHTGGIVSVVDLTVGMRTTVDTLTGRFTRSRQGIVNETLVADTRVLASLMSIFSEPVSTGTGITPNSVDTQCIGSASMRALVNV